MAVFYPEGEYICEGLNQGFDETGNGNVRFLLNFKVIGYEENGGLVEAEKQYDRTSYMVINNNTAKFQIENLRVLGFDGTSFSELDPQESNFFSFAGRQFQMYCKHETYEGKVREVWQASKGSGFKIEKPADRKTVRNLDNLFGSELRKTGVHKSAPRPQPVAAGRITDDDVPF